MNEEREREGGKRMAGIAGNIQATLEESPARGLSAEEPSTYDIARGRWKHSQLPVAVGMPACTFRKGWQPFNKQPRPEIPE